MNPCPIYAVGQGCGQKMWKRKIVGMVVLHLIASGNKSCICASSGGVNLFFVPSYFRLNAGDKYFFSYGCFSCCSGGFCRWRSWVAVKGVWARALARCPALWLCFRRYSCWGCWVSGSLFLVRCAPGARL